MTPCAICQHLALPPRNATGTVGLLTAEPALIEAAVDTLGIGASERHIVVHACPEHVVDVYRGRIPGVIMAWKLVGPGPDRQSPAAASASRA